MARILKQKQAAAISAVLLLMAASASTIHAQEIKDRNFKIFKPENAPDSERTGIPNGYAVIIGITHYQNADVTALRFPETDADAVYRALISSGGGSFPAENIHRLLGKDATLVNIRHELEEWLPSVAKPEDRVVVYFAGHGVISKGRGFLAPFDVEPARIAETAYPMQTLGNVLANRVKARWKALFADACHSGKINSETTDEGVANQLDLGAGQYLSFVATLGSQSSYEDPKLSAGFGLFSYFLSEGLRGNADSNPCDGLVTADELVEYVRLNVREYAARRGVMQTPHAGSDYDPAMPMGLSSGCGVKQAVTSISGMAIVQTELDNVRIFVDDTLVGNAGRGAPLSIPGLSIGPHVVRATRDGYKPETQDITVIPGQTTPVTIRMRFPKSIRPSALKLEETGEKLLYAHRSTFNPLAVVPGAQSQSITDIRNAQELFTRALQEDPNYSVAAYSLGIARGLLRDDEGSKAAFKTAIQIDPAYIEARTEYADSLIAAGDPAEAIRQLTEALRFEPDNDQIYARLAGAWWAKSAWRQCVSAADKALSSNRNNYIAQFRRADCSRQLAVETPLPAQKTAFFVQARDDYQSFLTLTNYSTPALSIIAFHFFGQGVGERRHADRKDLYNAWRNSGYLGLCVSEKALGNLLRARADCQKALHYQPDDAMSYFFLGGVNRDLFNNTRSCEYVVNARISYQKVLSLNPSLAEARNARSYLDQIESLRGALLRRGCTI